MHLLAISLLTILAGTLLLAKFRKETAGRLFAIISWFFIVVGLLLFLGAVGTGICKMSYNCYPGKSGCHQGMMMKDCNHGMMDCKHGMMSGNHGMNCCPCCMEGMGKEMCCGEEKEYILYDTVMNEDHEHMKGDTATGK